MGAHSVEFSSNRDASILPAGQKLTAKFDLYPVHEDIAFVPGKYRVVLDGFDGVSAEFAIIDSDSEPNPGQTSGEPIYEVKPKLGVYDVDAESITVHITNTSDTEGGYGRYYRIEEKLGDVWTPLPLEIIVTEEWFILPPGETQTQTYNLFRDQHDYSPGTTYRIILAGVAGEPSVVFELQE